MTVRAASVPAARPRPFHLYLAVAMAVVVFVGFARTYFLTLFSGGPTTTTSGRPFTPLVHLHAALFTGWVLLFIAQTTLVASRKVALHRKLGVAGATLGGAMVVVGITTAITGAARGAAPPGVDPLAFLAIPLSDMFFFGTFLTLAVLKRRERESHKRYMVLAYMCLLGAATARVPGVLPYGPFAFYGLAFLVVVAAGVHDFLTIGRVHKVYLWGGLAFVLSVPARLLLSGTAAWHAFAEMLTR